MISFRSCCAKPQAEGREEKENSTVQQHCRNSLLNVTQGVFAFVKDSATKRKRFTSKT